tara:strand:- start:318 stop:524 length:207 start_codon:yes stop_codon:yes gene_type:complete
VDEKKRKSTNRMKEEKLLQVANLSPSEDMIEKIVDVHPMKQVAIMSVVQVGMFGFMLLSFFLIDLVVR